MHKLKEIFSFLGGAIVLLIILFFISSKSASADLSSWLGATPLNLSKQFDFTGVRPLNEVKDCYPETATSCVVPARFGFVDSNGAVKLNGSDSYYNVTSFVSNQGIIGIPHSDAFMTYSSEPATGLFVYFNSNFIESTSLIDKFGKKFKITKAPEKRLEDKAGNRIAVDIGSRAFSQNGQWMVVAAPYIGILRIDLTNYDVMPFGPAYNYGIGLNPLPQLSITNDGRYAIAASGDFNNFNLYDLNTCLEPVPDRIVKSLDCQSRNIHSYLQSQISGYIGSSSIRFVSNDTFSFNSRRKEGAVNLAARYIISSGVGQIHKHDYLALGDSYISGEGVYNYQPGTDTDNNGCHLSLDSYPLLIGQSLNFNSYHSISCSGAITNDILDGSGNYTGQQKNKILQQRISPADLQEIKISFLPGRINQAQFVDHYQPKTITVSIGGNDIGFSDILKRCLAPGTCYSTYEDRVELIRQINRKFSKIANTYSLLKSQSSFDTKIYAIGYPQIANERGSCGLNVHLNAQELIFAQQLISYLNGILKLASDKSGVAYIDTQSSLDGHKLCEGKPGEVAINGLSAGNNYPEITGGPIGVESFHPNALGHKLLKDYILQNSEYLNKAMPAANANAAPPPEASQMILSAPKSGRNINISSYGSLISNDSLIRGGNFQATIIGSEYSLKPNSNVSIVIHSDPVNLGVYRTDSYANLNTFVTLPSSIEPGVHTLHIYGTDISEQPIDIYKSIFVNNPDLDVFNECVVVSLSGVDYDKDSIDDSCDSNITEPPTTQTPVVIVSAKNDDGVNVNIGTQDINVPRSTGPTINLSGNTSVLSNITNLPIKTLANIEPQRYDSSVILGTLSVSPLPEIQLRNNVISGNNMLAEKMLNTRIPSAQLLNQIVIVSVSSMAVLGKIFWRIWR